MLTYSLRRLLLSLPLLLAVTVIVFALSEFAPGDVADYFINPELGSTPEAVAALREKFGLNQPAPVRYARWLGRVVQGDLGFSFVTGRPVRETILFRLGNTLLLMGTALLVALVVGIPLGIFTALRQYSFWDYLLTSLSFLGISMPAFIAGILGLYLFSIRLDWFPVGGLRPVDRPATFFTTLSHLALPSLLLSFEFTANFMRYTRFSMLEVIGTDYVRTAKAKGLAALNVNGKHALRNALLPVVTVVGLSLPALVVGAVFTETIFSWPGMGTLYLQAVTSRDIPIIMGMNLVIAVVVLFANLVTDLCYGLADPRIRYD